MRSATLSSRSVFLSTPSARRATFRMLLNSALISLFLSTPSARRATIVCGVWPHIVSISIHALREEGDFPIMLYNTKNTKISIHALREEGDTYTVEEAKAIIEISIHALREEGDAYEPNRQRPRADFYPRPPRGGRPTTNGMGVSKTQFLSTPSARRATAKTETKSLFSYKLYNILHEFRRALIYNGSKNDPNHAKRLKNPVRRCRKNAENSPFAPGRKTQNNSRPSCSKGG